MTKIFVEKNEEEEKAIPHNWRPIFADIVQCFVEKDYGCKRQIEYLKPVSETTIKQIKDYIEDYGETLIELPEESWETSVYMYYGDYWNVYVDLFTENEGLSDLVLNLEVREVKEQYEIEIQLVFVP